MSTVDLSIRQVGESYKDYAARMAGAARAAEIDRDTAWQEVRRLQMECDEAVGAVRDLVDNYAATDQQAFEAAHERACRVIGVAS